MHVYVDMYMCTWKLEDSPRCPSGATYFVFLTLDLSPAWVVGQKTEGSICFLVSNGGNTSVHYHAWLCIHGFWRSNPALCAFQTGSLLTELTPQSFVSIFINSDIQLEGFCQFPLSLESVSHSGCNRTALLCLTRIWL